MNTTQELFVEIGCEELPAREVEPALEAFKTSILGELVEARLSHGRTLTFATPRRLCVSVLDVASIQSDRTTEVLGPAAKIAFKDGHPTKAAEGFAKGLGLSVAALGTKTTPKGDYVYASVTEKGQPAHALVGAILAKAIKAIPFRRSMRWGDGDATFARPIAWIVALFGEEVVPFSYGNVVAGRHSRGHRFLAPDAFEIRGAKFYVADMRERFVIADIEERKKMVLDGACRLAATVGGTIRADEDLVNEIVELVEYPVPLLGSFDPRFLEMPKEVLISEMREHQRYLSILGAQQELLPNFIVIANTTVEDPKVSLDGYRRVLSARFEDGRFFFNEDQKSPLASKVVELKSVQFHRALGSTYDKVERVVRLAFWLARTVSPPPIPGANESVCFAPADFGSLAARTEGSEAKDERMAWMLARAGYLMKADLTTKMVFEFPELQGVMGAFYARRGGEPDEIADAISEHYFPRKANDTLPAGTLGALLAIADRMDTIVGIFSTGKGPTGTADPFGLRRAALGILNILLARGWRLSLRAATREALTFLGDKLKKDAAEAEREVVSFVLQRLSGVLLSDGFKAEMVDAVITGERDDPVELRMRTQALAACQETPDFEALLTLYRRTNITRGQVIATPTQLVLSLDVERDLLSAIEIAEREVRDAVFRADFARAISGLVALKDPIDRFFEGVLVMDKDPDVRQARLVLLARVESLCRTLADLGGLSSLFAREAS